MKTVSEQRGSVDFGPQQILHRSGPLLELIVLKVNGAKLSAKISPADNAAVFPPLAAAAAAAAAFCCCICLQ
jgi:hypothetical protein